MIKAIIFDLDGTLLNTIEDIRHVLNGSLKKFGLAEVSSEQTKQYVGNGAKMLVQRAVGSRNELIDKVYGDYMLNFSECDNCLTELYEGEAQALSELKAMNVNLAILSNKPERATRNVYDKLLSEFGFSEVVGQSTRFPLKPDPSSTLHIIEKLGLKKSECMFVGDGEADVLTARAADICCVSVLWGYRTKEQLKAAGASLFAEDFSELLNIVKKII